MSLHIYFNIYIIPLAKLQNRKHNLAISLEKSGVPLYFNLVWEEKVGFNLGIFYGGESMPDILFSLVNYVDVSRERHLSKYLQM